MEYVKVFWISPNPDDPVLYFLEIGDDRWETRKIEIRQDGSAGYATEQEEANGVFRSEAPVPPIGEIAEDDALFPFKITREEFEQVWTRVTASS